jgi:hypothetical protein
MNITQKTSYFKLTAAVFYGICHTLAKWSSANVEKEEVL